MALLDFLRGFRPDRGNALTGLMEPQQQVDDFIDPQTQQGAQLSLPSPTTTAPLPIPRPRPTPPVSSLIRPQDNVKAEELPGIAEDNEGKKIAKSIQGHFRSITNVENRDDSIEQTVLASSKMAKDVQTRLKEAVKDGRFLDRVQDLGEILTGFFGRAFLQPATVSVLSALGEEDEGKVQTLGRRIIRAQRGVTTGALGSAEATLKGFDILAGTEFFETPFQAIQNVREAIQVENPTIIDQFFGGLGSTATFFIPGVGVIKGINVLSKGGKVLNAIGKIGGLGIMSGLEATAESGDIYEQGISLGFTEEEAVNAAQRAFISNVITLLITNKLGLLGEQSTILKRMLATGPLEGIQEALQQMIANNELGLPLFDGVPEAGLIGTAVGFVLGGGIEVSGVRSQKQDFQQPFERRIQQPQQPVAQDYFNILVQQGVKEGTIGENRLLQLRPAQDQVVIEREAREVRLTGPEQVPITPEPTKVQPAPKKEKKTGFKNIVKSMFELEQPPALRESQKPPSIETTDTLLTSLSTTKTQRAVVTREQRQERRRRAAILGEQLQKAEGFEILEETRPTLAGALTKRDQISFNPIGNQFTTEQQQELVQHVTTHQAFEGKPFEQRRAINALAKILYDGILPQPGEIALLESAFGPEIASELIRMESNALLEGFVEANNITRTIATTGDHSFLFRQAGIFRLVSNPKSFSKAVINSFRAMGSREFSQRMQRRFQQREASELAEEAGLQITKTGGEQVSATLTEKEEEFRSGFFEKMTRVRGKNRFIKIFGELPVRTLGEAVESFNRLATTFINSIRVDLFDSVALQIEDTVFTGMTEQEQEKFKAQQQKEWAAVVNTVTGRGTVLKLGSRNIIGRLGNSIFFSIGWTTSRFEAPIRALVLSNKESIAATAARKEFWGQILTYYSIAQAINAAADAFDWDIFVETDPTSAGFMALHKRSEKGDLAIMDLSSGYRIPINIVARTIQQHGRSLQTGKEFETTFADELGRFIRNRFSPIISESISLIEGKDFNDKQATVLNRLEALAKPISVEEFEELYGRFSSPWLWLLFLGEEVGLGLITIPAEKKKKTRRGRAGRAGRKQAKTEKTLPILERDFLEDVIGIK